MTFDRLNTRWPWKPIPNCPGRFVLSASPSQLTPEDLLGPGVAVRELHSAAARDPVIIAALADGGLISYRRANGTYVHTLNTADGFARKLLALGVAIPPQPDAPS